ncbi:MAG: undecaprenyl/decaprenyl-phosphate alpha-N-acetylglucosaminyl 1-phosphate transferase [Anaerolineae bacterium]|nr:undecaprenyl/decaprenyl-phosphate alpha-N-acetylglucosaminyl 1-phosphate transferase [Anaerolineae bacterium]
MAQSRRVLDHRVSFGRIEAFRLFYSLIFLIAVVTALALSPAAMRLSRRWGIMAVPGGRRRHEGAIPKLGGIAIFGAYGVAIGLIFWLLPLDADSAEAVNDALRLRGVMLGTVVVFAGGLLDDKFDLPPWAQFGIQITGALIAIAHTVFIGVFTNPLSGDLVQIEPVVPVAAFVITLLWIVGIMNAVNWLDGLDGLASGVGIIALLLFAWHSYSLGQTTVAAFPLALAGALVGFLPFNFAPARLFLGSAGAYVLGYNLATLGILSPAKIATVLLVLALPLLDGAWRILDRLRHGRNPLRGDRGHLHYRLADLGWPTRRIVMLYYGVALALGLVAVLATSGLTKLLALIVAGCLIFGWLVWLSRQSAEST